MDMDYMGRLLLSILIFAPGIILLTVFLFIGVLMGLEKLGFFQRALEGSEAGAERATLDHLELARERESAVPAADKAPSVTESPVAADKTKRRDVS